MSSRHRHGNQSGYSREAIFTEPYSSFYKLVGILLITTGLLANTFVIYLYRSKKIERTLFNFFLLLIGISNIFQNLGALPYLIEVSEDHVTRSRFECAVFQGLSFFFVGAFVTIYTICFMTIKWFTIVKDPLNQNQENVKRNLLRFVLILWFLSVLLILPNFFTNEWDSVHRYCLRTNNFGSAVEFYKGTLFLTGLIIPILVMVITYVLIIRQFYVKTSLGCNPNNSVESPVKLKYRKKVAIFLGMVILTFVLCWTPFGIYFLLTMTSELGSNIDSRNVYNSLRVLKLVVLPCFCAAVINVLCYGLKGREIKKAFKDLFSGVFCCCRIIRTNVSGEKSHRRRISHFSRIFNFNKFQASDTVDK